MPYFKDTDGRLLFLENDAFDHLLPAGSVPITDEEAGAIRQSALPPWSSAPILSAVRVARDFCLDRLMGIAFAADKTGDSATVAACLSARSALLDITKAPGVDTATDDASIKAALVVAYNAIVDAAPETVKKAFTEFNL